MNDLCFSSITCQGPWWALSRTVRSSAVGASESFRLTEQQGIRRPLSTHKSMGRVAISMHSQPMARTEHLSEPCLLSTASLHWRDDVSSGLLPPTQPKPPIFVSQGRGPLVDNCPLSKFPTTSKVLRPKCQAQPLAGKTNKQLLFEPTSQQNDITIPPPRLSRNPPIRAQHSRM
jgi:hypothetical protein